MKEQLKKMGSFEYYHTSFSYTLQETGEERFVGVPEQGGRDLISADPLAPGQRLHRWRHLGRHGRPVSRGGLRIVGNGKAEDGRRHCRRHEGVDQSRFQLLLAKKATLDRARPRRLRPPCRGDRPAEQPCRRRDRAGLLYRRVLRAQKGTVSGRHAGARRHECSGQHQAPALAR